MSGPDPTRTPSRRRLILHLGLPKTGTTTIQTFLRRNPEMLAKAGYIYPSPGTDVVDHPSYRPTIFQPRPAREINHAAMAEEIRVVGPGHPPSQTPLWRAAFAQVDRSGAHTAIVSFEHFSRAPRHYRFEAISSWLADYEVRGIIHLRRPEDWVVSLYGQGVRGKGRSSRPIGRFAAGLEPQLRFSFLLDEISEAYPLDGLDAVDFHAVAKSGLVGDFLARIGLKAGEDTERSAAETQNGSPPVWAVLFLLACNQAELSDEVFLEVRTAIGKLLARDRAPKMRPGLDLASPEERQRLRDVAEADAPRLAERYGIVFEPAAPREGRLRAFDNDDIEQVRSAIHRRLSASAREAVSTLKVAAR